MTASTQQAAEILQSLNEDGERQFAAGDLDGAQQLFERALDIDGRDATTLNNLAVCHWTRGETLQALRCVASGLEIAPDNAELAINGGSILESCGCAELARRLYRSFLEQSPDATNVRERLDSITQPAEGGASESGASDTDGLNRYGEERFEQGDLAAAEGAFRRCIELDPRHADALNNLGVLLWKRGDGVQSLQAFAQGLAVAPNDPSLVANAGEVLTASGHVAQAGSLYESYLRDCPGDENIQARLQNLVSGQSGSAVTLPADTEGQPVSAEALNRQGESLYEGGDTAGAARLFEQALQLNPGDVEALNNLGTLSWNAGEAARALDYFRRALEVDADHRPSLVNCAVVLEGLGYEEDARRIRKRAAG